MKKTALLMTLLLFINIFALTQNILPTKAEAPIIYVDDNNTTGPWNGTQDYPYKNITSALSQASNGYAIYVFNGTYRERLTISESISLIGESKQGTIIDANNTGTVIEIITNNVNISRFTIQKSGSTSELSGINVASSSNITLYDNIIKDNYNGIRLYYSYGIALTSNTIYKNYYGISISTSDKIVISDNEANANNNSAIRISDSKNETISSNNISNSDFGIILLASSYNTLANNNISLNNRYGAYLFNSTNNIFADNEISSNKDFGIWISQSNRNIFAYNHIFANERFGIYGDNSSENIITDNNISKNGQHGVRLDYSSKNTISRNDITENLIRGILFFHSSNNSITHNSFIDNTGSLSNVNSTNFFDNGAEGNYWSNYNGTDQDEDGIGDNPHIIDEDNQDNYPLMAVFSSFTIIYENETHYVFTICNSTISQFQYNETLKMIRFNATGNSNTKGFCRIQIPRQLIEKPLIVLVDDKEVNATLLSTSNTTQSILYFQYNDSTREVKILSKPYYELLIKYTTLLENYNILLESYQNLNATYYQILEELNQWKTLYMQKLEEYILLNQTYWDLLSDYAQLQSNNTALYNINQELEANLTALKANYESLEKMYNETSLNYEQLQNDYALLQIQYNLLNQTYEETQANYNILNETYNELTTAHNLLNQTYQGLIGNYSRLQNEYDSVQINYDTLVAQYNALNSAYRQMESDYANTLAALYLISIVASAIIAATLPLAIKYGRKSKKQEKLIKKYKNELGISLLESARIHFREDVQRRKNQMEVFEQKYGITLQPRDTLEGVIGNLDLKKKKGG